MIVYECEPDLVYTYLLLVWLWKKHFSLLESCSNPFLEPTSTDQWEQSFFLKETMEAFDGIETHCATWIDKLQPTNVCL